MAAHINGPTDLRRYGIDALTGEACAYSMRILCDLNEDGVRVLRTFFGLPATVADVREQFPLNWNSSVGGKPAIASIMLSRGVFADLYRFILFNFDKCSMVLVSDDGSMVGYTDADIVFLGLDSARIAKMYGVNCYRNPASPAADNGRNVHQFTGRTS